MKLTRGKKTGIMGLGIFLGFMAVCTIISKGIYASGLPRVSVQKPFGGSLTHEIKVSATVAQGQEYGVYVESGMRVAVVCVKNGDAFEAGEPLFQIETGDLQDQIAERELEIDSLKAQQAESRRESSFTKQEKETALARAGEDYAMAGVRADARISKCWEDYEQAREALARYDQYLYGTAAAVSGNDYLAHYDRQETRAKLLRDVTDSAGLLEDAMRQKEEELAAARRAIEDAQIQAQRANASTAGSQEKLEIRYREKKLERYRKLLEEDGWVYAECAGRVTDCRIAVGERTQDAPCILYAADNGERIIQTVFTREQKEHLTVGALFTMESGVSGGSVLRDTALLEYMEDLPDERAMGRLSFESGELEIGQNVQLRYKMQTENYALCIPVECIYGEENKFVYIAEEREGILGTEWKVRKVNVRVVDQNENTAAIESAEIGTDTRIVRSATMQLSDGAAVRLTE